MLTSSVLLFQITNENPTCLLTRIRSQSESWADCVRHWQSPQMLRLEFLKRPAKHRSDFRKICCHVAVNIYRKERLDRRMRYSRSTHQKTLTSIV